MVNALDYIEQQAQANGAERLDAYQEIKRRAYALATLLLGGGGAMGAYGLGALDKAAQPMLAWALLAASLWCFVVAGLVVWNCLQARPVYPLHNEPGILKALMEELCREPRKPGEDKAGMLTEMRWREVGRMQEVIASLDKANADVAKWLNQGYRMTVFTPVAAALGALAPCVWPRLAAFSQMGG